MAAGFLPLTGLELAPLSFKPRRYKFLDDNPL